MKKLVDFFKEWNRLPLNEQANYVKTWFPKEFPRKALVWCQFGGPIERSNSRVLIGVATWSQHDMKLLDELERKLSDSPIAGDRVEIFDISDTRAEEFDKYIPGIGRVFQTPILGIWEKGILVAARSGARARDLLVERYELDPASVSVKKSK